MHAACSEQRFLSLIGHSYISPDTTTSARVEAAHAAADGFLQLHPGAAKAKERVPLVVAELRDGESPRAWGEEAARPDHAPR